MNVAGGGAESVDEWAFAASCRGLSGHRLVGLEQVGQRASAHGCNLGRGSRVGTRERTASARDSHPRGGEGQPKKSHPVLRASKAVRFRFVEEARGAFPVDRLCPVMNVSPRGLRAFCSRLASRRQYMDMVVLAHRQLQSPQDVRRTKVSRRRCRAPQDRAADASERDGRSKK
jgi:hypothetical protein